MRRKAVCTSAQWHFFCRVHRVACFSNDFSHSFECCVRRLCESQFDSSLVWRQRPPGDAWLLNFSPPPPPPPLCSPWTTLWSTRLLSTLISSLIGFVLFWYFVLYFYLFACISFTYRDKSIQTFSYRRILLSSLQLQRHNKRAIFSSKMTPIFGSAPFTITDTKASTLCCPLPSNIVMKKLWVLIWRSCLICQWNVSTGLPVFYYFCAHCTLQFTSTFTRLTR